MPVNHRNNPLPKDAPVIITRPRQQNSGLIDSLKNQGRTVFSMPLIDIKPISNEQIKSCFLNLDNYEFVFPVSANAVNIAMQWVDKYWPQTPVDLKWLAVGPASKQALENHQIASADILMPKDNYASEGLLELDELQTGNANKVLILRAETGRSLFASSLKERGFEVEILALYKRLEIKHSNDAWLEALEQPAIVQINSSQTLEAALKQQPKLGQKALGALVPSQRIAAEAKVYFNQVWVSRSATDEHLLKMLC